VRVAGVDRVKMVISWFPEAMGARRISVATSAEGKPWVGYVGER
jgi:hypothetical protein